MSSEFSAMRNSLVILLVVTSGLGNPISSYPSNQASSTIGTFEDAGSVMHSIR